MENGLLSDVQWGFTPGRSTTTALLSLFHNIMQLAENGNDIGLVFFDLLRAFDSEISLFGATDQQFKSGALCSLFHAKQIMPGCS